MMVRAEFLANGELCPNCGTSDLRKLLVESHDDDVPVPFTVFACNGCHFAWQWPRPRTSDASKDYFEQEYEAEREGTYFGSDNRRKIAELEFGYVTSKVSGPGSLLDLGGGDGIFCEVAAQNGWTATCIDPALPAQRIADGNPRFVKGLPEGLSDSELFDVVTLWDVIEHVENPVQVLRSAVERLKPGGHLFVETGNFQSCGRIEAGADWWCYQSDHRWYFTPPVIESLMQSTDLESIDIHDRVLRPWWSADNASRLPGVHSVVTGSVRDPRALFQNIRRFREMKHCARTWPKWSNIEIFAMSGRLPG